MTSNHIFTVINQSIRQPTFLWYASITALALSLAIWPLYTAATATLWYLSLASIALFTVGITLPSYVGKEILGGNIDANINPVNGTIVTQFGRTTAANDGLSKSAA